MASFLREKVSRNKIRFREDGFDLDLTYITPRIIAMGFPSEKVEGFYRNPIGEVQRFYEKRHKDLYKLYNLCAERSYEPAKFNGRVTTYPFEDHNAPPVELIVDCCNDVHDWLNKDEKNIVGINCKAGKGRTGLIICCYLMHAGICKNADDAMLFYGTRRTKDGKGVTIASQKRYVRYYEQVLKLGRVPDPKMLKIKKIIVNSIPNFSGDPCATVIIKNKEVGTTPSIKIPKGATSYEIPADIPVIGDIKVQMDVKKGKSVQHTCHFWFNTGFVGSDNKLHFDKLEIDVASKDKKNAHFKPEFSIDVEFEDCEVDTSAMSNGVASPRRDGVKEKKDKKDKKKDKKGKAKDESEGVDGEDSGEAVKSPKKDKSRKDKGKEKDSKETVKSDDKSAASPKAEDKPKDKKDKKSKAPESTSETAAPPTDAGSFAPPASSPKTDDFSTKRKRRQSFYEVDEELENNEDLSDSAIEEMELEEYFEPESVDEDEKEGEAANDSPKATKSTDKVSSESSEADADKKPPKKQEDSSESSQVSEPKDKSESDKSSSKSIAISATSSSSRRGVNSSAAEKPEESKKEESKKEEPKDTPKSKKDKKDKESSKGGSDSPSQKSKKKKSSDN